MQINGYKRQVMAVGWCTNNEPECYACRLSRDTRPLGGVQETYFIQIPNIVVRCLIRGTVHNKRSLSVCALASLLGWTAMAGTLQQYGIFYDGEYEMIYRKILENSSVR